VTLSTQINQFRSDEIAQWSNKMLPTFEISRLTDLTDLEQISEPETLVRTVAAIVVKRAILLVVGHE
jgi:hypothetical protein